MMNLLDVIKVIQEDSLYNPEVAAIATEAIFRKYEVEKSDACTGCAFYEAEEWELPCSKCKRNCKDYWRRSKEKS